MAKNPLSTNPYISKTEGNIKRGEVFAVESQGNLDTIGATEPDVAILALELKPSTDSYFNEYVLWDVAKRIGLRATNKQNLIEATIPEAVRKMEVSVLNVFDENTEEYKGIFSRPRSYIYAGETQQQKLVNLKAESILLGTHPLLAPTKTTFDMFVKKYDDSMKESAAAQTKLTAASNSLDVARIIWCEDAYGITGSLQKKYKKTPDRIDDIFNMAIFDSKQSHVDPDEGCLLFVVPIDSTLCANMVFDPSKIYYVHNSGFVILKAGSASTPDEQILTNAMTFQVDETKIVSGAEFGDLLNRYFLIINEDPNLPGEFKIKEVLPEA